MLILCNYSCGNCKRHYSFIQEILDDSVLEKLENTKQKCSCGHIIEGTFAKIVPPLWKFAISGDEDDQILKFNNSECIVFSHSSIRIELSDLIRSGFSGRIDIFDNGKLIESVKVRSLFQDYLVNKFKRKERMLSPQVSFTEPSIITTSGPVSEEQTGEDEGFNQEEEER